VNLDVFRPKTTKGDHTVTRIDSDLSELLDAVRAGGGIDVIRKSVEMMLQALIDVEAAEFIGAEPHERTESRTNQRNGTRPRSLTTKAGDVDLSIPKLRKGSFSRQCSSDDGESTRRCMRSSWRHTSQASRRDPLMTSWLPSVERLASRNRRSAAFVPASTPILKRSALGHSITSSFHICSRMPPM
jgi:hypothetical protein